MRRIYIVGSLRQAVVRMRAAQLREAGHEVFDDWHASGARADHEWREYCQERGLTFVESLRDRFAQHNLKFDIDGMEWADTGLLVMPAGLSGALELGTYFAQRPGKEAHVLLPPDYDKAESWDLMIGLPGINVWPTMAGFLAYLKASS